MSQLIVTRGYGDGSGSQGGGEIHYLKAMLVEKYELFGIIEPPYILSAKINIL